jgi:preprotein translocase subunit Sec63
MGQIFNRLKRILEAEKNFPDSTLGTNDSDDELKRIIEELNKATPKQEEKQSKNQENRTSQKNENSGMNWAFDILGISSEASAEEVRSAYLKKIKEYHPDKVQNFGEEIRLLAERKTVELNRAYEYIKNQRNFK